MSVRWALTYFRNIQIKETRLIHVRHLFVRLALNFCRMILKLFLHSTALNPMWCAYLHFDILCDSFCRVVLPDFDKAQLEVKIKLIVIYYCNFNKSFVFVRVQFHMTVTKYHIKKVCHWKSEMRNDISKNCVFLSLEDSIDIFGFHDIFSRILHFRLHLQAITDCYKWLIRLYEIKIIRSIALVIQNEKLLTRCSIYHDHKLRVFYH